MPTKDRLRFIPRAVRCFQSQTHKNRELLVLDDGGPGVEQLLPNDPQIRYVRCSRAASLGAKRNLACELSRGEFIAHWDDDDWCHPERLETQIRVGAALVGFGQMFFWDEGKHKSQIYAGPPGYALGTSLFYTRAWWKEHKFSGLDIGEDNAFVRKARGVIQIVAGLGLMVATTHAKGTSPRSQGKFWKDCERSAIPADYWNL